MKNARDILIKFGMEDYRVHRLLSIALGVSFLHSYVINSKLAILNVFFRKYVIFQKLRKIEQSEANF